MSQLSSAGPADALPVAGPRLVFVHRAREASADCGMELCDLRIYRRAVLGTDRFLQVLEYRAQPPRDLDAAGAVLADLGDCQRQVVRPGAAGHEQPGSAFPVAERQRSVKRRGAKEVEHVP